MTMPFNSIKVDRIKDTNLYWICKQLERDGETILNNGRDYDAALRKLGKRGQFLMEKGLLYPIWKTANMGFKESKLIKVPKNIKVVEILGKKYSFFHFTEIKGEIE